jgi:hypothetical protein
MTWTRIYLPPSVNASSYSSFPHTLTLFKHAFDDKEDIRSVNSCSDHFVWLPYHNCPLIVCRHTILDRIDRILFIHDFPSKALIRRHHHKRSIKLYLLTFLVYEFEHLVEKHRCQAFPTVIRMRADMIRAYGNNILEALIRKTR